MWYNHDMSRREERRKARAKWPVRVVRLDEEELVDRRDTSTVDQRIALVWRLTREAWAFQGKAIPDHARREASGVVIRPR